MQDEKVERSDNFVLFDKRKVTATRLLTCLIRQYVARMILKLSMS